MNKRNKTKIPLELKTSWNKDYYELTSEQRKILTEFYVEHLKLYEASGDLSKKLNPPFFMTQSDILQKEEDVKMDISENIRDKDLIVLDEVDKLKLENIRLKLELIDKTMSELNNKKNNILYNQEEYALNLEKKYNIDLSVYNIDLIKGVLLKK